jgi:peroxiredoxin
MVAKVRTLKSMLHVASCKKLNQLLWLIFSLLNYRIQEGDAIPAVTFKARVRDDKLGGDNPFDWKDVSTDALFKGKRAVVFCLPGAFTPTCSSTHLPGYEEHYEAIKACGVDDVYCLSVNDAFVMRQWGIHQKLATEDKDTTSPLNPGNFKKVKLIPDGAALFTRGMCLNLCWYIL